MGRPSTQRGTVQIYDFFKMTSISCFIKKIQGFGKSDKTPPPQKSWVLKVRHRNFAGLKTFRKIYTLNLTKIINLDCPSLGARSARELPY